MRAALEPLATIVELDVDADPKLEARFGDRVPVLLDGGADGPELCHFRLDHKRVRDALATAPK